MTTPALRMAAAETPPIRSDIERVLLAIATCGRPRLLTQCLTSVAQIEVPPGIVFEVLLVDNNPGGEARALYDELGPKLGMLLDYAHVPQRGIAQARNCAIEQALERGVDALAFVDDDDTVDSRWLIEGLQAMEDYACDVITGPVQMIYPAGSPPWFPVEFPPKVLPTGLLEGECYNSIASTGNVLFRIQLVREWGLRFAPEFDLSGGEDVCFFGQARDRGAVTAWAGSAVVTEHLPASRACLGWYLRRRIRFGNVTVRCDAFFGNPPRHPVPAIFSFLRLLLRVIWRSFWALVFFNLGETKRVRLLGDVAEELGTLLGSLGYDFQEYRVIHGD